MARFRDLQKICSECMRHRRALGPEMSAKIAPVAQLDRAPDYESGGQEFESLRARHYINDLATVDRRRYRDVTESVTESRRPPISTS
jgi:hypothetical protein